MFQEAVAMVTPKNFIILFLIFTNKVYHIQKAIKLHWGDEYYIILSPPVLSVPSI